MHPEVGLCRDEARSRGTQCGTGLGGSQSLTSLTRCLTGRWPPPTPQTLSSRLTSRLMRSRTAARSRAALRERRVRAACRGGGGGRGGAYLACSQSTRPL